MFLETARARGEFCGTSDSHERANERANATKKKVARQRERAEQKRDYSRVKFIVGSRTAGDANEANAIAPVSVVSARAMSTATADRQNPISDFLSDDYDDVRRAYVEFNPLVAADAQTRDKVI